jgi:hypothetical protein
MKSKTIHRERTTEKYTTFRGKKFFSGVIVELLQHSFKVGGLDRPGRKRTRAMSDAKSRKKDVHDWEHNAG